MKIGIYHQKVGWNGSGGIAVFYHNIAEQLSENHDVTIYTSNDKPILNRLTKIDVDIVAVDRDQELAVLRKLRVPDLLSQTIAGGIAFWASILREGYRTQIEQEDVVLTGMFIDDLLISNTISTPVLYEFHANLSRIGIGGKAHSRLSGAVTWIANSTETSTKISEELGREVDGIVRPGVDFEFFNSGNGTSLQHPSVVFVGRLHDEKGVQDLIRAVGEVDRDVSLHIVGKGPHEQKFKSLAAELVPDKVTFHGFVPRSDLPDYFRSATVVCHPSYAESFGMTNIEAMAAGAPVITTTLPAVEEYASSMNNCILVNPGDVKDISDAIEQLLEEEELREEISQGGIKTAKRYSWEAQAAELISITEEYVVSETITN